LGKVGDVRVAQADAAVAGAAADAGGVAGAVQADLTVAAVEAGQDGGVPKQAVGVGAVDAVDGPQEFFEVELAVGGGCLAGAGAGREVRRGWPSRSKASWWVDCSMPRA